MASVNTNVAAITALRTLQNTNKQLDATQNRISTGYKIGEAKDNAAYWSISTTLKSDNKALSTVKDALSLGASTVDTAYQALNKAKDVLDTLKSKLTAASSSSADKSAIQGEISQLQENLKSIASAASFSGENWLSIDSSAIGYQATKSVVSSFTRDNSGNATIGTIDVDTSSLALTNASTTAEGILDGGKQGNVNKGGMADILAASSATGTGYQLTSTITSAGGSGASAVGKAIISLRVNNESFTLEVPQSAVNTAISRSDIATALAANTALAAVLTVSSSGTPAVFTSKQNGVDTSVVIDNTTVVQGTGGSGLTFTLSNAGQAGTAAVASNLTAFNNGTNGMVLDANDTISFKVSLDGGTTTTVLVDKSVVDKTLGTSDGKIDTVDNYVRVLNQALSNAGLSGQVTADKTGGNAIKFIGGRNTIALSGTVATKGTDIMSIDVTNASTSDISLYLKAVDTALSKVIAAASTLGSVSSRIETQQSFVDTLMDSIDKGVSGLIDADMSEESTKLQALQVKQQLGTQALSIANQSAQNILSLFQN